MYFANFYPLLWVDLQELGDKSGKRISAELKSERYRKSLKISLFAIKRILIYFASFYLRLYAFCIFVNIALICFSII